MIVVVCDVHATDTRSVFAFRLAQIAAMPHIVVQ